MTMIKLTSFLVLISVISLTTASKEDKSSEDDLFVFPSMQMEGLSLASAKSSLPRVQVNYRGEPTFFADSNKEEDKAVKKVKSKDDQFKVGGTTVTASTWNPDSFDHTVNPNKSRKQKGIQHTTPIPRVKPSEDKENMKTALERPLVPEHRTVIDEYKEALETSAEYLAFQQLKDKYLNDAPTAQPEGDHEAPLVVSLPSVKSWYEQSEIEEIIQNANVDEVHDQPDSSALERDRQKYLEMKEHLEKIRLREKQKEDLEQVKKSLISDPKPKRKAINPRLQAGEKRFKKTVVKRKEIERLRERERRKTLKTSDPSAIEQEETRGNDFPNFPDKNLRLEESKEGKKESVTRLPREYSITHQVLRTPEAVGVHHAAEIYHSSSTEKNPHSYHKITIVHPKDQDEKKEEKPPLHIYPEETRTESFLPNVITLHTTAKPGKAALPPHIKNKDTVVLHLPPMKPSDIPDGYELIPLDKLTPEYEVVPWGEAKDVLNVSVNSLGAPKKPNEPDHGGEPMSGYLSTTTVAPSPTPVPVEIHLNSVSPQEDAPGSSYPMSGFASPMPHPHHLPPKQYHDTKFLAKAHDFVEKHKRNYGTQYPQSGLGHNPNPHPEVPTNLISTLPPRVKSNYAATGYGSPSGYGAPQSGYATGHHSKKKEPLDSLFYSDLKDSTPPPKDIPSEPMSGLKSEKSEKPWYQPPPISPDLPTLYYDKAPKVEKEKFKSYSGPSEPPVVKSLHFHSTPKPVKNVMHFGSDFSPSMDFNAPEVKHEPSFPLYKELPHLSTIRTTKRPEPIKSLEVSVEPKYPYHLPAVKDTYESSYPKPQYQYPTYNEPDQPLEEDHSVHDLPTPTPAPKTVHHGSRVKPEIHAIKHDYPEPINHLEPEPEEHVAAKLIPLPKDSKESYYSPTPGPVTPSPTTPTTSPYPYKHWSSPKELFYKPTPSSYVKIKYGSHKDSPTKKPVKSLISTSAPGSYNHSPTPEPSPFYSPSPKPHHLDEGHGHSPSPKPSYSYGYTPKPQSLPKYPEIRDYHSSVEELHSYEELDHPYHQAKDYQAHTSAKPEYHYDPKEPKHHHSPTPNPGSGFYANEPLKAANYDYKPKEERPGYTYSTSKPYVSTVSPAFLGSIPQRSPSYYKELGGFDSKPKEPSYKAPYPMTPSPSPTYPHHLYTPSTKSPHVKSLGFQSTYQPSYSYSPMPYPTKVPSYNGIPGDIPLHINHFPSPTPISPMLDFYTSPKPVYKPGGLVKELHQYLPAKYSSPYTSGHAEQQVDIADDNLQELKDYLAKHSGETNSDSFQEFLVSLSKENGTHRVKISIPTKIPERVDISSLQRMPNYESPLKFSNSEKSYGHTADPPTSSPTPSTRSSTPKPRASSTRAPFVASTTKRSIPTSSTTKEPEITTRRSTISESLFDPDTKTEIQELMLPGQQIVKEPNGELKLIVQDREEPVEDIEETEPVIKVYHPSTFNKFIKGKKKSKRPTTSRPNPVFPDRTKPTEAPMQQLTAYGASGNNIIVPANTGHTLLQLTSTLRGLTSTVRGLNSTIMEATERMQPNMDLTMATIAFMQDEIERLSNTVEELRAKQVDEVSKDKVKEVLMDVVKEAHKVAKFRSELLESGIDAKAKMDVEVTTARPITVSLGPFGNTVSSATATIAEDGIKTHVADNVEWKTLDFDEHVTSAGTRGNVEIFNIPVSASFGSSKTIGVTANPVAASMQVSDQDVMKVHTDLGVRKVTAVVGTSFAVDKDGNIIEESVKNPFLNLKNTHIKSPVSAAGFASYSTTAKPLTHSFRPEVKTLQTVRTTAHPRLPFNPSTRVPAMQYSTTRSPIVSSTPNAYAHRGPSPSVPGYQASASNWHPYASSSSSSQSFGASKPVRFPGSSVDRIDQSGFDYDDASSEEMSSQFSTSYYNSKSEPSSLGPKSGVNIMADLAESSDRKNLLGASHSRSGYIQKQGQRPSMEVIMYPSGQLLKGSDPEHPPSSTIGPKLENALLNSYYRNQLPHYVLAKNRAGIAYDQETSASEESEIRTDSSESSSSGGLLQGLIDTARDDLKLVGNVLKLALS